MSRRLPCLSLPLAAALLLAAAGTSAQEPAVKAAPARLVVTTAVPAARAALDTALFEVENAGFLRAEPYLRRALELDPGLGLARALLVMHTTSVAPAGVLREMDRAVADAGRGTPAELLVTAADREMMRGAAATAALLLETARKLVPDDPYVAVMLIWPKMVDDPQTAARLAREYLARNPDLGCIENTLTYTLYHTGDRAGALAAGKRYTELLPNHPNPHDSYAEVLQWSGRLDEARQEYQRALQLDPSFVEAYYGLAEVATLRHDYAAARAPLEAALARAATPQARIDAHDAMAFHAAFAGDDTTMWQQLGLAIAEAGKQADSGSLAWQHTVRAGLEAVKGRQVEARQDLAASGPFAIVTGAIVHSLAGDGAAVHTDLQALQAVPGASAELVALVRVMEAATKGSIASARSEASTIKNRQNAVMAQAYVAWGARRAHDPQAAQVAEAEIASYGNVDGSSAFAHLLANSLGHQDECSVR